MQSNFKLSLNILFLHCPRRTHWHFLSPRYQAIVHRCPHHFSVLLYTTMRSMLNFSFAESTAQCAAFRFRPHFNDTRPLSSSVFSFILFGQVWKLFIHNPWFIDRLRRWLPFMNVACNCQVLSTSTTCRNPPLSSNQILRQWCTLLVHQNAVQFGIRFSC